MTEQPKITKRDINQCLGSYCALYCFADVLNGDTDIEEVRKEILAFKEVTKEKNDSKPRYKSKN